MLSIEDALGKIRDAIDPVAAEEVYVTDALGRVLAADLVAEVSHPPQDVSAMDGYAVRAADVLDTPKNLTMIGEAAAGHVFTGTVGEGECTRIFTGGGLPEGADTVIIQEDTKAEGDQITMLEAPRPAQWVRSKGLDFAKGKTLIPAGQLLSARDLGLAAAAGATWLSVRQKPRIAVLATGDEVVMPGAPRREDQIVSSNSVALVSYAEVFGADAVSLGVAADEPQALREKLNDAKGFDLLVTSGGASVGDHDLVQSVSGDQGMELGFYKIAMRPGKPLIFGQLGGTFLLGLPGNPVSTGVTAAIFMRAAIEELLGLPPSPLYQAAKLGRDLPENGKRLDFMRAAMTPSDEGLPTATPFERQDSSMMAFFAEADCLVMREIGAAAASEGDTVKIVPLRVSTSLF